MKCPYCEKFIEESVCDIGEYHENGYDCDAYWDEYRCECPCCGKTFRWFENYIRVEDDCLRMED